VERLSLAVARRIALAAHGFADPRPSGGVDRRHLRRVVGRTGLLQIDSVNVFARAHYVPAYSRLGPYPTGVLDRMAYAHRELFEYWGHDASLLPVALHPLLRWRMARAEALQEGWGRTLRLAAEQPALVADVLRRVEQEGPVGAGALRDGPRTQVGWWGWDATKTALEFLFWAGRVTTATRRGFERVYDLTERVLPPQVLALPTPGREEAQRELVRIAARTQGVATESDLRDHFRLRREEAAVAVASLVEEGALVPVEVEGWRAPAYLWPDAAVPRRVRASTLVSPFDPLLWERPRAQRLLEVDYRIEIYVPASKRVHGYYVLPFLHDEAIRARVDLKSDRKAGVLRVLASWLEPGSEPHGTAQALAGELRRAADWQGLADVVIEPRGDLAPVLAGAVRRAGDRLQP
jgi:uncharacterized protein YcaQ